MFLETKGAGSSRKGVKETFSVMSLSKWKLFWNGAELRMQTLFLAIYELFTLTPIHKCCLGISKMLTKGMFAYISSGTILFNEGSRLSQREQLVQLSKSLNSLLK